MHCRSLPLRARLEFSSQPVERRSISMIGNRICVVGSAAATMLAFFYLPAAGAPRFDGPWTLTAVTTKGHCGVIPMTMEVVRGRVHGTGGSYAFIPISLG